MCSAACVVETEKRVLVAFSERFGRARKGFYLLGIID